jgi:hypothetical protein
MVFWGDKSTFVHLKENRARQQAENFISLSLSPLADARGSSYI